MTTRSELPLPVVGRVLGLLSFLASAVGATVLAAEAVVGAAALLSVVAVAPLALTSPGAPPPEKQPRDRRKPQRPCPNDFRPSESNWDYAAERGLSRADVDRAIPRFVNWHQARDNRFADWPKAFRNWLENTRPGEGEPTGPRPLPGVSTLQPPSLCWEAGPEYTG